MLKDSGSKAVHIVAHNAHQRIGIGSNKFGGQRISNSRRLDELAKCAAWSYEVLPRFDCFHADCDADAGIVEFVAAARLEDAVPGQGNQSGPSISVYGPEPTSIARAARGWVRMWSRG